ncbi:hypothetical protein ADL28_15265 [Streptomyces violaceusniger]|uniref:Uncharacterized protein n=1 Tax=Streptomyces violaceusniger TaxID=68280 RepID=A0A0X3WXR5_STRVO|nr:hypothetical protein ADL28_15265 [Streptomyces violaceusniger]
MSSLPEPAHVIADDTEKLKVAAAPAEEFRTGAAERDARRRLPRARLDRLSASGLPAEPPRHGLLQPPPHPR